MTVAGENRFRWFKRKPQVRPVASKNNRRWDLEEAVKFDRGKRILSRMGRADNSVPLLKMPL